MKQLFYALYIVPCIIFGQEKPLSNIHLVIDSLKNQVIYISQDSLVRLDATDLSTIGVQKILSSKTVDFYPLIRENKLIFVEEKGGDVFELSKKDSLVRIENSNIKNFLIGSAIFVKKDTLFRHGGYGYWSQSNFFTYLAEQTEEWEVYPISNTSIKPIGVHDHLTLYNNLKFYFFGGRTVSHTGVRNNVANDEVWSFDFLKRKWSFLGKSNATFLNTEFKSFKEGNLLYVLGQYSQLHSIDIEKNICIKFTMNPVLHGVFHRDPVLYQSNLYYVTIAGKVKKIALSMLTNTVSETSEFYEKKNSSSYYLIGLVLLFLFYFTVLVRKYLRRRDVIEILENGLRYKGRFVELDEIGLSIIKSALNKEINLAEVKQLVQKEHLSAIQNERIKNQYIAQINTQIKVLTGINKNFLVVAKSTFDGRYKTVTVNRLDFNKFIK